jgi:filamentous hemagglutinin family protein
MNQSRLTTCVARPVSCKARILGGTALSGPGVFGRLLGCLFPALIALSPAPVQALPQNGAVVAGQADIVVTSPTEMRVIQHSDKVAIDWATFNVGANEVVLFIQNSALSQALNRVLDGGASQILGRLTANGQIILSNAAGIHMGPLASIDVHSLIATTANLSNQAFMAGTLNFDEAGRAGSSVVNQGRITVREGGLAALVAPGVENAGVINARLGHVALASADTFTIDLYGDGLIKIAVARDVLTAATGIDGRQLDALASNSGAINAAGGVVQISANAAKTMLDNVINMSGTIRVETAEMVNGEVVLSGGGAGIVAVSGTLDASGSGAGQTGGTVKVLGEKIALAGTTAIDVSGEAGGGTALIGGNFQGKGAEGNASRTFVAAGATIAADATKKGDGGRVIVWADEVTAFNGQVSAKGGAAGGDGGFVEVSGKETLLFRGGADLSAAAGQLGTLLLDPRDIVIQGGTADGTADTTATTNSFGGAVAGTVLYGEFADAVTVRESEIEGLNANIVLEAAHSVSASGTFTSGLALAAGRSLTVQTRNDPGDQTGSAKAAGIALSGISAITTSAGGTITMATGTGANSATGSAAALTTAALTTAGGAIELTAGNGGTITTGAITSRGATNQAGGAVTMTGTGQVTAGAIVASGGTASSGNHGQNAGAIAITGGDVTVAAITASGSAGVGTDRDGGTGGAIALDATDATPRITLGGNLTTRGGAATGTGTAGNGGAITVKDPAILAASVTVNGSGAVNGLGGAMAFLGTIDGNAAARTLTLTGGAGGDITVEGAIGGTMALSTLTVTGNDIGLGGIGKTTAAGVTGTTTVTAATAGADVGSIAFTGTTYNANTQTYTAPAGETLSMEAGAATQFSSTADTISFATGTVKLADGSGLTVSSAAGAIAMNGGIRGTSAELVTLTSGAGAGNIGVGAIGEGEEIGAVAITSGTGTTTLYGDIKTADVAGNAISITGRVTNAVAIGGTLTLDAAGTTNKGAITITGATTSAARNLALTGGAVTTAAVTTTGGANQAGGAVTMTGTGQVTAGAIVASGGTASSGNHGQNAGAIAITGGDVTVAAITASGSAGVGTDRDGGTGGAIALDATDATPRITLGGNLTTRGGAATGTGTAGNGGAITVKDPAILAASVTVNGSGAVNGLGGAMAFLGTIDGNAAARTLTLTGGAGGDITVEGAIGGTMALSTLTVTGNDIGLGGIGKTTAAGVTGTTTVTAATAGADVGSIAFTGTTYNANTQTYTAPAGETLSMEAGAATQFSSTADTISFATGTVKLADGSGLTVSSAAGAIAMNGGIRGTSAELVTLTSGAGAGNIGVGAIGEGEEIGAVAITSGTGTTTLYGDIKTADVAGNAITITGPLTNAVAIGGTLTLDAAGATNKGAITITGATSSAARNLALTGGTIATGTITTRGGTNQAGGSVTMTGGAIAAGSITTTGGTSRAGGSLTMTGTGQVTAGAIVASGGTASAANGQHAGAVAITGADVTVAAITASGTAGSGANRAGGNGGDITLDATDATPTINLGGSLTAVGGARTGTGTPGNGGTITVKDQAVMTANVAVNGSGSTGGTSGALAFLGTIDGNTAGTRTLTLTGGAGGDVTVAGAIGGATALSALTVTGNDITLAGVGTAATAGVSGATSVTAATLGADTGSITLSGLVRTTGTQNYAGTGLPLSIGGDLITANQSITIGNPLILTNAAEISAGAGTLRLSSTVNAGAHALTLSANEIDLAGAVSGSGALTLRPGTATAALVVGATSNTPANELDLRTTELALIQPGFLNVTFGRGDASGATTINALSAAYLKNDTTFRSGAGILSLAGDLTTAGASLTFDGPARITANRAISTAGGDIAFSGDVATAAAGRNLTLTAGAGDISVAGAVGGTAARLGTLTANAGGDVTFAGSVTGGALALANTPNASFAGPVNLTGAVTAPNSVGNLAFRGGLVANSVSFANTGALTLGDSAGDATTLASGLDTSGFGGTVNLGGTIATTNAALTLGAATLGAATTLDAGTGTLTAGAMTGLGHDLTVIADTVTLTGAWTGIGAWTLHPATASAAIGLAGAPGAFGLDAAELARLSNGQSRLVTIGRADGTGTLSANAMTFDDPLALTGGSIALLGTLAKPAGALTLSANGAVSGDVMLAAGSGTLRVGGDSALLTGTVNGRSGLAATYGTVRIGAPGTGPYTINGEPFPQTAPPDPQTIRLFTSQFMAALRRPAGGVPAGGLAQLFDRYPRSALNDGAREDGLGASGLLPAEADDPITAANALLENVRPW